MLALAFTSRRRSLLISCLVAVTATTAAPSRAAAADASVPGGACREVYAFLTADAPTIRREGRIPGRWKLALGKDGTATAFITTLWCDITVNGLRRPVIYTTLSALLDSTLLPAPERQRSTSKIFDLPLDFYLLTWSTNDADFARWLQDDTGLGDRVGQVPDLSLRMSSGEPQEYSFSASSPTPSPFSFTATVTDAVVGPSSGVVNFWRETSKGSVMIETTANSDRLGAFEHWRLAADPASPLARMLGGDGVQKVTCAPDRLIEPLVGLAAGKAESGCFAYSAMQSAQWRKDIPPEGHTEPVPCASRRAFRIHLPRGWRSAMVSLDGRVLRVVRHRQRLSAVVDLRGRPAGVARLRIVGQSTRGRRVTQSRTYRICER